MYWKDYTCEAGENCAEQASASRQAVHEHRYGLVE